jgi:2-oxoglutarate-Fe(II)-dependent oxygenase superfamily protein
MTTVTDLKLPGKFAIVVDGLFSPEECAGYIRLAENENAFSPAGLNTGTSQVLYKEIRDCGRWINDDPDLAGIFFERLRPYLPETAPDNPKYHLVGLNERLRFLKYEEGQFFKGHYDGSYTRPDGSEQSFVTVQIYLNDVPEGGHTRFLNRVRALDSVAPKAGRVLIFEHEILHEGSKVMEGLKYVIRTDVMFSKAAPGEKRVPPSPNELRARKIFNEAVDAEMQGEPNRAVGLYKAAFKIWPQLQNGSGVLL